MRPSRLWLTKIRLSVAVIISVLSILAFTSQWMYGASRKKTKTPDSPAAAAIPEQTTAPKAEPKPAAAEVWTADVQKLCTDLKKEITAMDWDIDPCVLKPHHVGGKSVEGRPLIYWEFGDANASNSTLILSMVHADENTPLYLGFKLIDWLNQHIHEYPNTRVIVAPMVNPDGFFKKPKTRTNARGVDVNRNFGTSDWHKNALRWWREKSHSNPRRFPGNKPDSEPETIFQKDLIAKYQPRKILSIHSPLSFMDYDGPDVLALDKFSKEYVVKSMQLRTSVNAIRGGFYPGSLGNYAGQQKGIPTLTLELPTANTKQAQMYWERFQPSLKTVIEFQVPSYVYEEREK